MVRINGLFHLLINGVYWGYNPLILTIDPNFQRDIQVLSRKLTRKIEIPSVFFERKIHLQLVTCARAWLDEREGAMTEIHGLSKHSG